MSASSAQGPGVAALHLPTLARLGDRFTVVHVSDGGSGRAAELAAASAAAASSGIDDLLADPAVDVVAICSPPAEHARQIRERLAAGKRAILCEKPLATTRRMRARVIDACREAGVRSSSAPTTSTTRRGTGRSITSWRRQSDVRTISVTVALPPNGRYHAAVTELGPGGAPAGAVRPTSPIPRSRRIRRPQLCSASRCTTCRSARPRARFEGVVFAAAVRADRLRRGLPRQRVRVRLTAVMLPDGADALWRLTIGTRHDRVDVEFPPLVRARRQRDGAGAHRRPPDHDLPAERGRLPARMAGARRAPGRERPMEYHELLDDAIFAIDLADAAAAAIRAGGPS